MLRGKKNRRKLFLNRELSWLAFARRVLALAESPDTPLLERVKFAGIVGMLHAAGVDVNLALGNDLTALMWAAGFSNDVPPTEGLATVSLLLDLGAEVNRRDNRGRTALMTAAERDYAEVVGALVKAGARPGIEDNEGKTARDLASAAGSLDAIKALGAAGSAKP